MSLNYPIIQVVPVIGSKSGSTLTGVQLESTYQTEAADKPTKTFETAGFSKMNLDLSYTMGATETSNTIEVKVEGSPDGDNFYRIANDSTSGGTSTLTAREFQFTGTNADTATISVFLDIAYKFVRVSVKETGVVTNKGNIFVEATLSGE